MYIELTNYALNSQEFETISAPASWYFRFRLRSCHKQNYSRLCLSFLCRTLLYCIIRLITTFWLLCSYVHRCRRRRRCLLRNRPSDLLLLRAAGFFWLLLLLWWHSAVSWVRVFAFGCWTECSSSRFITAVRCCAVTAPVEVVKCRPMHCAYPERCDVRGRFYTHQRKKSG